MKIKLKTAPSLKGENHFTFFLTGVIVFLLFSFGKGIGILYAQDGKTLFRSNCAACHFIGKGRLVGPDLKGVTEKRAEEWLLKWTKSSQSFIKSGDADAVAIFNEYNKVPMTDFSFLSDEQIKTILTYIKEESSAPAAVASAPVPASEQTNQTTNKNSGISFSVAEYFLLSLVLLLLLVILLLSRTIKKLSNQLVDYYAGNSSFF